jgi:hypothetical protein
MAAVDTQLALAEYQRRIGILMNEVIMRDVAINQLERDLDESRQANLALQERLDQPQPGQDTLSAV